MAAVTGTWRKISRNATDAFASRLVWDATFTATSTTLVAFIAFASSAMASSAAPPPPRMKASPGSTIAIAASCRSHSLSMASRERPRMKSIPSPRCVAASMASARRATRSSVSAGPKATREAPTGHFADAVAGNDAPVGHRVSQRRRGSQRLQRAEDVTVAIAVQRLIGFGPDHLAGIPAAEQCRRMRKQVGGFRNIAGQGKHRRMLPCPARSTRSRGSCCQSQEDRAGHSRDRVSLASTKSVMARRSADPPGLSLRATKLACTDRARSRQPGLPTPPSSRKRRAARRANRRPGSPPRCSRLVSSRAAMRAKHASTRAASPSSGASRAPLSQGGQTDFVDAGKSLGCLHACAAGAKAATGPAAMAVQKHGPIEDVAAPKPRDRQLPATIRDRSVRRLWRRRRHTASRGRISRRDGY